MIVEIDQREAEKSDNFAQKRFTVKSGAKIFQLLSENLYSNKPLAVIRELVANAHDAQKDNNTLHIPVKVKIPNYIDNWFSIRDFGMGISHEFMIGEEIVEDSNGEKHQVGYTTIGHSTKDTSNEFTGGFGIGRCAAFSISDSYTVVSTTKDKTNPNKNIRRFYSVFLEKGEPNVAVMGETEIEYNPDDSDTYTGFEVKVSVKDHRTFETEALKFLSNIDFPVEISGTTSKITQKEVVLERKTWRVFNTGFSSKSGTYHNDSNVYAKMGIVRYPINNTHLPYVLHWKSFEIDFPIGSLEITPRRESLSYTEKTIEVIKLRAAEVIEEIKEEFNTKLAAAPTLWDARKLIHSLNSGELSRFSSIISDCRYKDAPIYSSIKLPNHCVSKYFIRTGYRRGANRATLSNHTESSLTANDNVVFVIDESIGVDPQGADQNATPVKITYPRKRIEKYLGTNPEADFYVFGQKTYDDLKKSGVLEGAPDPIYLSKLPFDPIVRVKSDPKTKKVFDAGEVYYVTADSKSGAGSYGDTYKLWSDNSILPKEGYYIVVGKNERYMLNGYHNQYAKKLGFCRELDIKINYVFGIHPRKEKSFLKQYPDWKLATELDKKIKKELDKRLKGVIVERVNSTLMEFLRGFVAVKEFHSNPKVSKLKTLVDGYDDKRYQNLEEIAGFYGIKIPESLEISNTYTELYENYPLLRLAGGQMYKIEEYKAEWTKYLGC